MQSRRFTIRSPMTKKDDSNDGEITLRMVINDMHYGFGLIRRDIKGLETRICGVEGRLGGVEGRLDKLEKKMDTGLANLNNRLKELEWHDLPKRVSVLEDKVFAGADPNIPL